jgi:ribonuclease G
MTAPCPTCAGTGRIFTPETVVRRVERAVRRIAAEGRREPIQLRLHPETALHVLTEEADLVRKLEKLVGFPLEMRDDPLLRPDEVKLVVKGAERDVTEQYVAA